ncbi:hypothetical protein [Streptococcus merionis]|uniref:Amino acid transporter n=1 Tax=Streptococcus merionis TaxID=400065 RepID=A0A239SYC9_9STRE|nr:hypothetical protein [Streptococcus merionis]SNU89573.1 amino acid transporter [Streptococcus merionis]
MKLISPIFHSVFKRRDVAILLAFSILPLLTPAFSKDIQGASQAGEFLSSAMAFFDASIETQYQLILPSLILGLIVSSVFHDEINSGILFLYKDLKRSSIFNAKLLSLFGIYGLYFGATFLTSLLIYYLYIIPSHGIDAHFLPVTGTSSAIFLRLLATVAIHLILISLIAAVSIKKGTLQAVLYGVLFNLTAMIAPLLNGFRYTFPNTYPNLIGKMSFGTALMISLGLSILYLAIAYFSARRNFNKMEF